MKWRLAQKLEIKWWERYLKKKDLSSYLSWKEGYWKDFVQTHKIPLSSDKKSLDMACGPAGIFMLLNSENIHACDPLIEDYTQKFPALFEKFPHVRFIKGNAEEFMRTDTYDIIYCLNGINHFKKLEPALINLHASLKEEGDLFITVDAHKSVLMSRLFRFLGFDALHPQQYTRSKYKSFIQNVGLEIKEEVQVKKGFLFSYVLFKCKKRG